MANHVLDVVKQERVLQLGPCITQTMTAVTQSETYTTGSGDKLELRPVCKVYVLIRIIRMVMFNQNYSYGYV